MSSHQREQEPSNSAWRSGPLVILSGSFPALLLDWLVLRRSSSSSWVESNFSAYNLGSTPAWVFQELAAQIVPSLESSVFFHSPSAPKHNEVPWAKQRTLDPATIFLFSLLHFSAKSNLCSKPLYLHSKPMCLTPTRLPLFKHFAVCQLCVVLHAWVQPFLTQSCELWSASSYKWRTEALEREGEINGSVIPLASNPASNHLDLMNPPWGEPLIIPYSTPSRF